jgi:hypothetical protein
LSELPLDGSDSIVAAVIAVPSGLLEAGRHDWCSDRVAHTSLSAQAEPASYEAVGDEFGATGSITP